MKNENIIFNSRTFRKILVHLSKKEFDYGNNIAKDERLSWSDVATKLKILREFELIEPVEPKGKKKYPFLEKNKRSKYNRLTEKGKRIVDLILKINSEFENNGR